jgi:hypothetical protein
MTATIHWLTMFEWTRWADQCPNEHDKNRLVPDVAYVGQNMADSWSSVNSPEKDLAGKMQMWYNEVCRTDLGSMFFSPIPEKTQPFHKGLAMQADVAFCFMPGA